MCICLIAGKGHRFLFQAFKSPQAWSRWVLISLESIVHGSILFWLPSWSFLKMGGIGRRWASSMARVLYICPSI